MSKESYSVLWLPGIGGPGPGYFSSHLDPRFEMTFIYDPTHLDAERHEPAMRAAGRALPVRSDEEALQLACEIHQERAFDAVSTYSEGRLALAAKIAHLLTLRFHDLATAHRLTDKLAQRAALQAGGVPVPQHVEITSRADLVAAAQVIGFPAVLKPVVGGGSRLTFPILDEDDLRRAWEESQRAHSADQAGTGAASGDRLRMVLEVMLVRGGSWYGDPRYGDYVSVESGALDGAFRHVLTLDKLPLASDFRENGSLGPSVLPPGALAEVHEMTERGLRALGVTQGVCHTELKLTADGPRIIEVNGRPGGGTVGMLRGLHGYDLVDAMIWQALGCRPLPFPTGDVATGFFTPCIDEGHAGQQLVVDWREELATVPGIREFYDVEVSHFERNTGGGRAAVVYVEAASHDQVFELNERVRSAMDVRVIGEA